MAVKIKKEAIPMKKTLAILLTLALLLGLTGTALADDDWITLKVEAFDRDIPGFNVADCMQLHYAQEHFGDPNHIKLEFVPVARWTEGEKLGLVLGTGNEPNICITYDGGLVNKAIEDEEIYQLDELLEEYGQNLIAFLGRDTLLPFGQVDTDEDGTPEQWFIPARRLEVENVGNFIRADWLAALNMEKPTDIESFEAYLRAAKEANLGGAQTIPMQFDLYEANPLYNVNRFTDAFIDFSKVTEEDWFAYCRNHEMLPGAKEGYRWLNKLYHEGLLYENFDLDDDAASDTALTQGYFGFFSMQPDQPWRPDKNYEVELENNVPGASWTSVNCFKNASLDKYLHDVYAANGLSIIIPVKSTTKEQAIAAIKYLDWMSLPENMFFMQNGVEGINYLAVTEEGIPTEVQSADAVPDEYKMHAGDIVFISNGLYYGSDERNAAGRALKFDAKYTPELIQSYIDAGTDAWTQISFSGTIQAENDFGSMVQSKQGAFLSKVITCAPEDFDKVYDEAVDAIRKVGADDMIEEFREAYNEGRARGTFPGNP